MIKRMTRVLITILLAVSLVACSGESDTGETGQTYALKLWGSQEDQAFLKERIEAFKAANPDNTYNIELAVVSEADARDQVLQDVEASADVFAFANDHIRDLVSAKALYEVTLNKEAITEANVPGSIEAATLDGKLYAYPFTADNGYFLYYDSEVVSDTDAQTLEGIVDAAEKSGKKIYFDISNGWYLASFFLGAGGKLEYADGKNETDFNNETGVKVGEYLQSFVASPAFITGDDSVLDSGIADGSIVAAVSGTWKADYISGYFGNGYSASKLPTFDLSGQATQLSSFAGYKLYGVSSATEHPLQALALAEFLSNEESQKLRFEARGLGPSNINVANSDAVKQNVALNALAEQVEFAHSQKDVTTNYWNAAESFGTEIENHSTEPIQSLLDKMVEQIQK